MARVPPEVRGNSCCAPACWSAVGAVPTPGEELKPDQQVSLTREEMAAAYAWSSKQEQSFKAANLKDAAPKDPQLARAIEVLKAALDKRQAGKIE